MWIEVFKTGEHTDSSGNKHTFSTSELNQMAEKYNDSLKTAPETIAPIVKGHPESDSPAYGWVERLARRGEKLFAKIKDIEQNFYNELKDGRYKKVSIALYPDLLLRHIGFLGASQPAVKNLQLAKFNEMNSYYAFDSILSQQDLIEDNANEYNENFKDLEQELNFYKAKLEFLEKEKRLQNFRYYLNNQIEARTLTPAQIVDLVDLLEISYNIDEHSRKKGTFSENNSFESKLKRVLNFVFHQDITSPLNLQPQNNNSKKNGFEGKYVLSPRLSIHNRAEDIMNLNPGLSYEEAVVMAFKEKY